jgi:hypothetical protein
MNVGYACTGCYSPQTDIPVEGWDIKKIEMWNTGDQLFFDQDTGGIISTSLFRPLSPSAPIRFL